MSALDAFGRVVRAYPGGCASLAPRLGTTAGVLRNKLHAGSYHRVALDEAVAVSQITGSTEILEAFAEELGCVVVAVPPLEAVDQEDLFLKQTCVFEQVSALMAELKDAIQNAGCIDDAERYELERRARAVFAQAMGMLAVALQVYGCER